MGEAILSRAPQGLSSGGAYEFATEIITVSKYWTVPTAKNQEFSVRIFGGGGYGADGGMFRGGGGGYGKNGYGGSGVTNGNVKTNNYAFPGGGGVAYGPGGGISSSASYGGGGYDRGSGASGVCIIQYYKSHLSFSMRFVLCFYPLPLW